MIEWESFYKNNYISTDGTFRKTVKDETTILWTVNSAIVPVGYGRTDKQALEELYKRVCDGVETLKRIKEDVKAILDGMDGAK